MDFVSSYFKTFSDDCLKMPYEAINLIVSKLVELREKNGRLFILELVDLQETLVTL